MHPYVYRPNKKNTELFDTLDQLNECNEEILYHATNHKAKRLDQIEKNAILMEQLAKKAQEQVKAMRRKP